MNPGFQKIVDEYHSLTEQLASGSADIAKIGKRQAQLLPTVEKIENIEKI